MTKQKIKFRGDGSSRSAVPESSVEEARDRLAGLLPDDALQDALEGLGPEEITGPGALMSLNVPATAAYVDQLRGQGIAKSLTAEQMTAQLAAQAIDLRTLTEQMSTAMTETQRTVARTVLAQAVPLKCYVSVKTRLLVEPTTGRSSRSSRR